MLRHGRTAIGTITADHEDYPIWPAQRQREPAVYVRRLVVSRAYAGLRLGADLLDWAALTGRRRYGAQWIRVDVWRTNKELHAYYERQGFLFYGMSRDPDYPSGALFQKATAEADPAATTRFTEIG